MFECGLGAPLTDRSHKIKSRESAPFAKISVWFHAFIILLGSFAPVAAADVVFLQSGDRISGKILEFNDKILTIETAYAGTIKISRSALLAATTDEAVRVQFTDGTYIRGLLRTSGPRKMFVSSESAGSGKNFTIDEIGAITRKEITPPGIRWSGRINIGFTRNEGNSDTQSIHVDGAIQGRSRTGRISADLVADHETDRGEETVDDGRLRAKYDHFMSRQFYIYGGGGLKRDALADLTLRSAVGAGVGYQIYETHETNLSLEGGPAYIHEEFANAQRDDSAAFRWAADFKQQVFGGAATIFHDQEGFYKFAGNNAALIFAKTGVRLPFRDALNVTAEVDADFDGNPASGKKKTDWKYMLTVGYFW